MNGAPVSISNDPSTWRNQTPNGIPYRILDQTGTFRWDSASVTEMYLIRAFDLQAFVRESFPLPTDINGLPEWQARGLPGNLRLLCKEISYRSFIEGKPIDPLQGDPDAHSDSYGDLIQVDVTYSDETDQPGSGNVDVNPNDPLTFLEIRCNAGGEFFTFKGNKAKWKNDATGDTVDNKEIDFPASLLVPQIEWSLDWPMLNYQFYKEVMIPRLRAANGKVNSTNFTILWDAEPETMMLGGWETTEERQTLFTTETQTSQYLQNPVRLSVKMIEKRIPTDLKISGTETPLIYGHNHFWRNSEGGWSRFLPDGTNPAFKTYDFNDLFAPVP